MQFVTRGEIDEAFIRSSYHRSMTDSRSRRMSWICGGVICLCIAVMLISGIVTGFWDIVLNGLGRMALILLGLLVFLGLMKLLQRWSANQAIRRVEEENPGCRIEYETGFAEDGVHLHHVSNGAKVTFAYAHLKRLMPVRDEWVLLTRTNASFPVFVSQLSETDRASVLKLLKEHNPKLRIDKDIEK